MTGMGCALCNLERLRDLSSTTDLCRPQTCLPRRPLCERQLQADSESSSEKEEQRNAKQEGARMTKPRAALFVKYETKQEGCELWPSQQLSPLQGSMGMPFCRTSGNDGGLIKNRKKKKGTDPGENLYVCPQCGNSFNRKSSLNRHVRTIHDGAQSDEWTPHGESFLEKSKRGTRSRRRTRISWSGREPYECPECGESFVTSASFTTHRKTHTNEATHWCLECEKSYTKERYLIRHLMKTHSGAHLSKCPDCGKGFLEEEDLSKHQRMNHGGERSTGDQDEWPISRHQRLHTKEVPCKCPECEKVFADNQSLVSHWCIQKREKFHKYPDQEGSDVGEYAHTCPDCGMRFKLERCFVNHQRIHMKERQCQQPDKGDALKEGAPFGRNQEIHVQTTFSAESASGKPVRAISTQPQAEREEARQLCPDCGKIFRNNKCFANHLSMHAKEVPSENADSQEMVEERRPSHGGEQESHLKEQPYRCCRCGKAYATQDNLNRHQCIHAVSRPYKCTVCGETFSYRYALVDHEATHTEGEVCRHKCSYCGKTFARKISLSRHKQLHVMDRPYLCDVCGISFAFRYSLTRHLETHTQGQGQKCNFCWKIFHTSHSLSRHKRIHLETRSYQCPICGKAFGRKYSFYRHQNIHLNGSLSHLSSSGGSLVDGSGLAEDEASDTDENSNNWSENSALSGDPAEEPPAKSSKSADDAPRAQCQSVHREGNSAEGLDCEGALRDNPVSLPDQANHVDTNVNDSFDTSVCPGHRGVHTEDPLAGSPERVDINILTKPQSTPLKENPIKRLSSGETFRDNPVVTKDQGSYAEENVQEGTYHLACPGQQGACLKGSLPASSGKLGGFTASFTLTEHQNIHIGVNSMPGLGGEEPCMDSSTHSGFQGVRVGHPQHMCSQCGKSFRYKYRLTRHERTHTLERPYQCQKCGKRFCETKNLIKHQVTHTDLRPYPCSECGKHFKTKTSLDKHRKVHNKPFGCSLCGKRVTTSTNLKYHLRIHTGEKPFKCTECGKDFRTKSYLTKHREKHLKNNACEVPKVDGPNRMV